MKASCQRKDPLKWSVADIHIVQCSNKILQLKRICYRKYLELVAEKASWCHKVTELNVRLLTRHFRICGKEEHLLGQTVTFLTYRYFKNLYKTLKFELLYAFELKPYEHAPILSLSSHNLLACCHAPSSEVSIWLHFVCVCVCECVCVYVLIWMQTVVLWRWPGLRLLYGW